jgi:alkylmercury lyase
MVSTPDLFDDAELSGPVVRAVRRIAVFGFQALWSGRPVTLTELLGEDGTALTEATEHLRLRGRIELSADGHLVAVHGLSQRPTPHRIEHHDAVISTWCALDAIGIPAALAIDAWARTKCPTCQSPLSVRLSAGDPQPLPGAVLWYPEVACSHLIDDFCSGANLFCTIEHLERWARGAGSVMTINEVAGIGREVWADAADLLRTGEEP